MKESGEYEQMETDDIPSENKHSKSRIKILLFTILAALIIFLAIFFGVRRSQAGIKPIDRRVVILGIGPVSQTLIPILDEKMKFKEFVIYDKVFNPKIKDLVKPSTKITVIQKEFDFKKFKDELSIMLEENDLVIDLFSRHSSLEAIKATVEKKNAIYLNSGIEDRSTSVCGDYSRIFKYNDEFHPNQSIVIGCGANPGMITHFVKLGLVSMAKDAIKRGVKDADKLKVLLEKKNEADLAEQLGVEAVHVSELETNEVNDEKEVEGFATNSWSIETFIEECIINGEISLNEEDLSYFKRSNQTFEKDGNFELMYNIPPETYIRSATPFGMFTGKVTTHEEIIEISELLSNDRHKVTTAFVYHPSRLGRKTLKYNQDKPRKIFNEENCGPLKGFEIMGATLISKRKDIPARWYGSIVSCEESRRVGCTMNPTTLQVAAGLYSHMMLVLENPKLGIVYPHSFDSEKIMELAKPYLGIIYDINLPFNVPYKWEDLKSTEQEMNYDI